MISDLQDLLGKTITGIVVKKNLETGSPAAQIFLVFDDNTNYEIYSMSGFAFTHGLYPAGIEYPRRYMSPPRGNMKTFLETYLNDEGQIETPILDTGF